MDGETGHLNSGTPSQEPPPPPPPKSRRRRRRCLYASLCCVSVLVLLAVIIVILVFTVFRQRDPTITVTSITLDGVSPSLTLVSIQLNLTLLIGARIYNPNRVSFSHPPGTVLVFYKGVQIGNAAIGKGKIPSRGSANMNATFTLTTHSFAQANLTVDLIRDVRGGEVGLDSKARLPGRIKLLGFIKKHVVAISKCHFIVGIPSIDIKKQECSNKAKL